MAARRRFEWHERDKRLLRMMGIAAVELPFPVLHSSEAQAELCQVIKEPIGQIGRLARIRHKDGRETRKFCLTQSEAVAWLEATMRPLDGDELIIENARRPKDLNCAPYHREQIEDSQN